MSLNGMNTNFPSNAANPEAEALGAFAHFQIMQMPLSSPFPPAALTLTHILGGEIPFFFAMSADLVMSISGFVCVLKFGTLPWWGTWGALFGFVDICVRLPMAISFSSSSFYG